MNPNVERVTLDLGYRRLFEGVRSMAGKWGSRPDVGVLYKNGSAKVVEVLSRTDNALQRLQVHNAKWLREGLGYADVEFNEWAVRLDRVATTVRGWFQ